MSHQKLESARDHVTRQVCERWLSDAKKGVVESSTLTEPIRELIGTGGEVKGDPLAQKIAQLATSEDRDLAGNTLLMLGQRESRRHPPDPQARTFARNDYLQQALCECLESDDFLIRGLAGAVILAWREKLPPRFTKTLMAICRRQMSSEKAEVKMSGINLSSHLAYAFNHAKGEGREILESLESLCDHEDESIRDHAALQLCFWAPAAADQEPGIARRAIEKSIDTVDRMEEPNSIYFTNLSFAISLIESKKVLDTEILDKIIDVTIDSRSKIEGSKILTDIVPLVVSRLLIKGYSEQEKDKDILLFRTLMNIINLYVYKKTLVSRSHIREISKKIRYKNAMIFIDLLYDMEDINGFSPGKIYSLSATIGFFYATDNCDLALYILSVALSDNESRKRRAGTIAMCKASFELYGLHKTKGLDKSFAYKALDKALEMAGDESEEVREVLARGAEEFGWLLYDDEDKADEVLEMLITLLGDESQDVQERAIKAIGTLAPAFKKSPDLTEKAIFALTRKSASLLEERFQRIGSPLRNEAAKQLAPYADGSHLNSDQAYLILNALWPYAFIKGLEVPSGSVNVRGVEIRPAVPDQWVLYVLGDYSTRASLPNSLDSDRFWVLLIKDLIHFASIDGGASAHSLATLDAELSERPAMAEEAIETLIEKIDDNPTPLDIRSLAELEQTLEAHPDRLPEAVESLLTTLTSDDDDIREDAREALRKIQSTFSEDKQTARRIVRSCLRGLKHDHVRVRQGARSVLNSLSERWAIFSRDPVDLRDRRHLQQLESTVE